MQGRTNPPNKTKSNAARIRCSTCGGARRTRGRAPAKDTTTQQGAVAAAGTVALPSMDCGEERRPGGGQGSSNAYRYYMKTKIEFLPDLVYYWVVPLNSASLMRCGVSTLCVLSERRGAGSFFLGVAPPCGRGQLLQNHRPSCVNSDQEEKMDVLYVVMPAYNEEANIEATIRSWYPIVADHDGDGKSKLVIYNDGSKDSTFDVGKKMMEEFPLLEMKDKANSGHGPTVIAAYNYAIDHGADFIFQTDSDGQTNPNEFEAFWEDRHKYDGIFGVRAERGDGKDRAFVEKVVCFLLRLYFGVKVPDANAPFRLMKADVAAKYLRKLPADYNLPNIRGFGRMCG